MPRLSRLRLVCVGHPQARIDDLTLQFQDRTGRASNSTIWLRNAGGKSSLVALFLSVLQPGKNRFLGKQSDTPRRVEDYVQAKDRSVIVCEWELDEPHGTLALNGSRRHLLTGAFYEWKQQTATERDELKPLFFAAEVRPDEPKLTLEGLPLFVEQDGRKLRRTLANFKQEWLSLRDQFPGQSIVAEETYQHWLSFLDSAHIDPELFKFQIQMNRREGAADEIFRFAEHEDFVDFLIEVAADPSFAERCSEVLTQYRKDLRERTERLLPERDLLTGLLDRLVPLKEIAAERLRLRAEAETLALSYHRQVSFLDQRLALHRDEVARLNALAKDHVRIAETAGQQAHERKRSDIRARLLAARLRLKRAEADEQTCRESHEQSLFVERITAAAIPLRNAIRDERLTEHYRQELDRTRKEHAPQEQELREAANAYAGRLKLEAERSRHQQQQSRLAEEQARREVKCQRSEAAEHGRNASAAQQRATSFSERLVEAQRERDVLVQAEILAVNEWASAAVERIAKTIAGYRNELVQLELKILETGASIDRMQQEKNEADRAAASVEADVGHGQRGYDQACDERCRIESESVLCTLLEVEAIDLEQLADEPLQALERESSSVEERLLSFRIEQAQEERAVHFLESNGLLPPSLEVQSLFEALRPRFPQLWTGWAWIEKNRPRGSARRELLSRFPHVATGLVVRDQDFEAACQAAQEWTGQLPHPVVIAPQRTLNDSRSNDWLVIGPSSDAYFDQQVAVDEHDRLKDRIEIRQADIGASANHRHHLDEIAARFRSFRDRFPRGWFADQESQLAAQREELQRLQISSRTLAENIETANGDRSQLQSERDEIKGSQTRCERQTQQLADFVNRYEAQEPTWTQARNAALAEAQSLEATRTGLLKAANEAEQSAEEHSRAGRLAGEAAARHETSLKDVRFTGELLVVDATTLLDELRTRYEQLKSQYESQVDEGGLRRLASDAEGRAKQERQKLAAELRRLNEASGRAVTEKHVESRLLELGDGELVEQELATARERTFADLARMSNASQECKRVRDRLADVTNEWQLVAALAEPYAADDPARSPEEWESFANLEAVAASELMRQHDQSRQEAARADADAKDHQHRFEKLEVLRSMLSRMVTQFSDWLPSSINEPFPADEELFGQALTEGFLPERIRQLDVALRQLQTRSGEHDRERAVAVAKLRTWINDDRFQTLRTAYVARFQTLADNEWESAASDWSDDLTLRLQTIEGKLAEYDQHRTLIVEELSHVVEDGLELLRSAGSRSRMPEHVPDFGGSQILKIHHNAPSELPERRDRLGTLVDQLVKCEELPRGLKLFQTAIRHVARPIRVQFRNPNPLAKEPYLDVTRLAALSGGERMTSAILMYCTLAQLRGRTRRSRDVRRPSSVLILDNPIGTANSTTFLDLQRRVAEAMDIQLIYTTGVNDLEAIRILPNVIRMRNSRSDRRSGHRLLETESEETTLETVHIVRPIDDSGEPLNGLTELTIQQTSANESP